MAIRQNLIELTDEEFIAKTNYKMFIVLVKIAQTNLGILKYSQTVNFLQRYFRNITQKQQMKIKVNPQ